MRLQPIRTAAEINARIIIQVEQTTALYRKFYTKAKELKAFRNDIA